MSAHTTNRTVTAISDRLGRRKAIHLAEDMESRTFCGKDAHEVFRGYAMNLRAFIDTPADLPPGACQGCVTRATEYLGG